jgi:hypothetical protein
MKKIILSLTIFLITITCLIFIGTQTSQAAKFISSPKSQDDININEKNNDNLFLYGKNVNINKAVNGDLFIFAAKVNINAPVNGNVFLIGNDLNINDKIKHDAFIVTNTLTFTKNGQLDGSLYTRASQLVGADNKVSGRIHISQKDNSNLKRNYTTTIISLIATYIVGLLLLKFAPKTTAEIINSSQKDWGKSLFIGVITLFIAPIAAFILMVSLIGIPLGLALLIAYIADIYLGTIVISYLIGRLIFKNKLPNYLILLLGLFIFKVLQQVSFIQPFALLSIIYGMGLIINSRIKIYQTIKDQI